MRAAAAVMLFVVAVAAWSGKSRSESDGLPLRRVDQVTLPGPPSRFDYQAVDPVARRLYIAHLGDSSLDVVGLDTGQVVATVRGIASVHGVAVAPDRRRAYATATGTDQLDAIDTLTDTVVARIATGRFPDGVAYDPDDGVIAVSNKDSGSVTFADATTNTVIGTVKLGDETGNVSYDPASHTLYVAVRAPDLLVAIDPASRRVRYHIRLRGCDGAHGVALDPARRRAFVACERNAALVAVDLHSRRVAASASVGTGPDVLARDPGTGRLYVAAESGTVTVFDTARARPRKIGQGHLADHAHTVAVDPATHRVYFPLEDVDGRPLLRVFAPTPGP